MFISKNISLQVVVLFFISTTLNPCFGQNKNLKIKWTNHLKADFSFTKNWDYPLGVERKENGKAGCADGGFCPERCYNMLDSAGNILPDSVTQFYQLLDTTHLHYTLECTGQCNEWAGSNYIVATQINNDTIFAATTTDVGTHCSLQIFIMKNEFYAQVVLNSIVYNNDAIYPVLTGSLMLDKKSRKNNILKGLFEITFKNGNEMLVWKGKILTPIVKKK